MKEGVEKIRFYGNAITVELLAKYNGAWQQPSSTEFTYIQNVKIEYEDTAHEWHAQNCTWSGSQKNKATFYEAGHYVLQYEVVVGGTPTSGSTTIDIPDAQNFEMGIHEHCLHYYCCHDHHNDYPTCYQNSPSYPTSMTHMTVAL